MLTRLPNGDIEGSVRPPLVYLDHWAIREISSDPARRDHFLETFRTRGTLMFSEMNVLEMARNTGASYARIRELLDAVEPYWLLSDVDPGTVWERELRGLVPPQSFLAPSEIFARIYKALPEGTLRLGAALDRIQDAEFREGARGILERAGELQRGMQTARERCERGDRLRSPPFPRGTPRWISLSLVQALIRSGKRITENDRADILHASVPLAYADIVLLDRAWTEFARQLELPGKQVFAMPQLDEALEAIRTVDISRHGVVQPVVPGSRS